MQLRRRLRNREWGSSSRMLCWLYSLMWRTEDKPNFVGLTERHELQRQGIEVAKADGKHLGRPRVEYLESWEDCYGRWKSGVISAKEAMTLTGFKKDSFYRLVKKFKEEHSV